MQLSMERVTKELGAFIVDEVLLRSAPLSPEEDLFAAGFDSMSLSRVLVFCEDAFGLVIPDQDVVLDEVSTLDKLSRFVVDFAAKKQG